MDEPAIPDHGRPLRLRPPRVADEAAMRAGHEELSEVGFAFLLDPGLRWGEQLDLLDRQARGRDLGPGRVRSDFLVGEIAGTGSQQPPPRGSAAIVGRVSIRHTLTPLLFEIGGHVGYAVRPAFRGRGYATAMLQLSVRRLADLGVDDVLVTCDDDNLGSIRVIERSGGVLADVRQVADGVPPKRRYWIDSRS
ncbi:MAG: GNAT family N-acetyltransferase [Ornithinimicrobium sp.]